MTILKWYSIIILGLASFLDVIGLFFSINNQYRFQNLLSAIVHIPAFIYLLLV